MAAPLDKETVERVLRRAQELSDDQTDRADEPGVVDEAVLIEAAAEAGIDAASIRRSLAMERFVEHPAPSHADRVVGPREVTARGVVDADQDEVLERLDAWLTTSGRLVAVRRTPGRSEWVPRTGVWAALRGLRRPPLAAAAEDADRVTAEVSELGDDTGTSSAVRVTLDRSRDRASSAASGLAVTGAGVVGSVAALTVLVPGFLLVTIPAVGFGGWLARSGGRRADRMSTELDRLLEVVDAGDRPPTMTDKLRRRAAPSSRPED